MALQSEETEKVPSPPGGQGRHSKDNNRKARDDSRDVSPCQACDLFGEGH